MKRFTLITLVLCSVLTSVCSLQAQSWIPTGEDLRVDPPETKVGIGLAVPAYELDINGTLNTKFLRASNYLDNSGQALALWYVSGSDAYFSGGNVGIGTSTPGYTLEVNGTVNAADVKINGISLVSSQWSTTGNDVYYNSGNVGIGTGTPLDPLHIYQSGSGGVTTLRLEYDFTGGQTNGDQDSDWRLQAASEGGKLHIAAGAQPYLTIDSSGNVGIGTIAPGYTLDVNGTLNAADVKKNGVSLVSSQWSTTGSDVYYNSGNVGIGTVAPDPAYKLSVLGKIRAEEIVVETNWSDFVFEDDYRLMPLQEVEQHILENKRLPDIPSAAAVEANGVSLGQMQAKLLQKVEELTLYVIELKKENEAQKRLINSMSKQVEFLKNSQ